MSDPASGSPFCVRYACGDALQCDAGGVLKVLIIQNGQLFVVLG